MIGFTGGAHTWPGHADMLTEAGAETVINRLADLPGGRRPSSPGRAWKTRAPRSESRRRSSRSSESCTSRMASANLGSPARWPISSGPRSATWRLNPPDVAGGIADASDPVSEEELRDFGHGRSAGLDRARVDRIGVLDIETEKARRRRPVFLCVEEHDDRVADPHLGMTDAPVGVEHARQLLAAEGGLEIVDEPCACPG